jgi:hypothetical protein
LSWATNKDHFLAEIFLNEFGDVAHEIELVCFDSYVNIDRSIFI